MKGVILAGGTGSRLHPLTRITNKHLLPLYDRPMINYGIEALVGAGVGEIMLVTGEKFVAGDRCVVLLADNVFERSLRPCVEAFGKQKSGARVVLSRESDRAHLCNLGVAQFDGNNRIARIIEKPEQPPSDFAVTGVYFYDESVWRVLPELKVSGRGELEITDVNNWYLDHSQMEYDVLDGFWGDAGESIPAYHAVGDFVRAHGANKES
ncbi:MAG: spore coat protein [Chloroflexi bacterium]|nr:MAG: spore coat protein [Chloroflexota bacterium]